jgi:hypothetical protein
MKSISNVNYTDGIKESWVNVKIFLSNSTKPIVGVKGLSYTETNSKVAEYGIGSQPIGYSSGRYEYDGSINLYLNEVEALQTVAFQQGDPQGSITTILPFDVIITIGKTGSTTPPKTQVLKNVVFQSNGRTLAEGDGAAISVEIPILFSHILWVA